MDSDGDGLDDSYDNFNGFGGVGNGADGNSDMIATGTSNPPYHHDTDISPDYLDLDTDNDGLSDIDEAWDANGDNVSDVSGCGTTDIDGDGLLDCYDSDTASPLVTSYNTTNDTGFNLSLIHI